MDSLMNAWNAFSLSVGDYAFGWLLRLPTDLILFIVAALTTVVLTGVRRFTTPQELLHRADDDTNRLDELIKEAKKRRDPDAVQRHRATKNQIGLLKMRCEGWPFLASILPIALLGTWAWYRLEFHPPKAEEPVKVIAYTPVTAAGEVMHVVPVDGLQAQNGWVQRVEAITDDGPPYGKATWTFVGKAAAQPYNLDFRLKGQTYTRPLAIGERVYSEPLTDHGNDVRTEVQMKPLKLFGIVPGIAYIGFPPWLVAYLIFVIPLFLIIRKPLHIY